ncbi:4-dihydroxy-2-butanone 4-phosphate synthase [Striga asiatica]|uniref:4-dihydroxy-2-butanone 4-phosphate synthase n=1 Tax=Striga asiatica TaxID=4170 RepID=A0A5A7QU83_STRAF|nr:4-dihydroxy-2-butanone 4-phosphate synthase [Striga asiatica]
MSRSQKLKMILQKSRVNQNHARIHQLDNKEASHSLSRNNSKEVANGAQSLAAEDLKDVMAFGGGFVIVSQMSNQWEKAELSLNRPRKISTFSTEKKTHSQAQNRTMMPSSMATSRKPADIYRATNKKLFKLSPFGISALKFEPIIA